MSRVLAPSSRVSLAGACYGRHVDSSPCRAVLVFRAHAQQSAEKAPSRGPAAPKAVPAAAAAGDVVMERDEAVAHWKQALAELDVPKDSPKRKYVVASVAPAVRVAIAESFGLPPGSTTPGQLAEALRRLGFDAVYDTLFAADLTIMEEGTELIHRLKEHLAANPEYDKPLPMFTSCCPGWVGMMEKSYPDLIPYVSSCKSPQMMMGAVVKTYLAEKKALAPQDICMVSVMPCVRKQGEADRPWHCQSGGVRDVDHVITTAELGTVLKERNVQLPELPDSQFDNPIGDGSGGAVLFGTTGGVMEAALRTVDAGRLAAWGGVPSCACLCVNRPHSEGHGPTSLACRTHLAFLAVQAYEVITGQKMERLQLSEIRGMDGIKAAAVTLKPAPGSELAGLLKTRCPVKLPAAKPDAVGPAAPLHWDGCAGEGEITLRVAVANGLGNAKKLITKMQSGEVGYDFVEVMACPAGCVGGGGQPRSADKQVTQKRQAALYDLDDKAAIRRSHENPAVQKLYEEFLGEPNSHKAHELLHTHYQAGGVENE